MDATHTSRRGFLQTGGALVVGFALPTLDKTARAATAPSSTTMNAWLRIAGDGKVTILCGSSEMGQGVATAIPMLIADELDADWSRVEVEQAPADKAYNNPAFGMQGTGGSATIRAFYLPLRQVGAAAREMLVAAAAAQWGVPADQLRTDKGQIHGPGGKKIGYGALAEAASKLPVPAQPKLKDPMAFKLIGKPTKRLDSPDKSSGKARFGIDAQVPGLLVAVMARAPNKGAKPKHYDEAKAKAVPGVQQVIALPSGVAVLATGYWAAKQGRDALAVDWDLGDGATPDSSAISTKLEAAAREASAVALDKGQAQAALAGAAQQVQARYEAPYLAHACMEPMNCTAWVQGTGPDATVEIWAGTQSQGPAQGILGQVAQVAPGKVKVHTLMLGGGFGRRFAPDFAIDATLLSKISGKPVKLIYGREDDMAAQYYRPASVAVFEGGLDAQGRLVALKAGVGTPSIMAASGFMAIPPSGVDAMALEGLVDHPYAIANQHIAYGRHEPGPQVWFWRSVGHSQNSFFSEGFIDEMAAAARQDPYEFRRALLGNSPRHKAVLELAAQKAGWGQPMPAGRARGIAVVSSFGSYVAEVAEVSVDADGRPRVHRVVAAVDCGRTVNPLTIERQIEGAIVYGLSAALYGRISYKDGRIEQSNFNDYPVLRMNEMPQVEVHIVASNEPPSGIGEPGTPPIAPAVVNAIYALTGKRLRSLPIDPNALKKA
ncbi:MAG: xanthine dehydrogenase family protein molybdopterin-binding subunit [Burkholderiales bacterium]|nr:xanthine dehydrogenase family protein molybdopterin-binding subunit [Burkholderiales bacterium]